MTDRITRRTLAGGLLALPIAKPAQAGLKAILVDQSNWYAALRDAAPGAVLVFAPGRYPLLRLYNLKKDAPGVTLAAANGAMVSFVGLSVNSCSGLVFEDLTFNALATGFVVNIGSSEGIRLNRCRIEGPRVGDGNALMARGSSGIEVLNCEVLNAGTGLNHLDCRRVRFTGNHIHDLRSDAIRGGGSSDVEIVRNRIHSLYPEPADHPDGIQFWTRNTTTQASNILVSENDIRRGEGRPFQGIFIGNEAQLPYLNLVVTKNLVTSGMWQGIAVGGAIDPLVEQNFVQSDSEAIDSSGRQMSAFINVNNCRGGQVRENVASGGYKFEGSVGLKTSKNRSVGIGRRGDDREIVSWRKTWG